MAYRYLLRHAMSWLVITTIQERGNEGDKVGFPLLQVSSKSCDEHPWHSVTSISNNSWEETMDRVMSLDCRNVTADRFSVTLIKFCGKRGWLANREG